MKILEQIKNAVYEGLEDDTPSLVQAAVDEGIGPQRILDTMMAAMEMVGEEFKNEEIYIPEVLCSCYAMQNGSEVLKPLLTENQQTAAGTIVLGSVKGDMHDIGKNLVKMMFEGRGFKVVDIGIDVPEERFVEAAVQEKADIVACSALLTTTMPEIPKIVKAFEDAGVREQFRIMIGGAPITQDFCDKTGCDAFAKDAGSAAETAVQLCRH
ncbi:corrinoid protein [Eubacterium sp. 1001713B170207_170306_E7]|uniref:cobalamin B12-binding domain-containing protein n=1 Tax=Eubacterium sp. 1001713B170207_170306_E7 TaxID=2787097 RepID=UPI001898E3BA|nr:corrinoid protein [Eubacterium sp. 1001713B170207_170306_E7]